jgi:hypothetical protein
MTNSDDIAILVEVAETTTDGRIATGRFTLDSLRARLGEIGEGIAEISHGLENEITTAMSKPRDGSAPARLDMVELAFKLGLKAEFGLLVTRGGGEASFEVRLTWQRTAHGDLK